MLEGEVKANATKLPIYMKELIPERINKCHGFAFGFSNSFIFYILSQSLQEL